MFKLFFLIFLISHILGDFYFQSDKLALKKVNSYKNLLLHSLLYLVVLIICILPFWSTPLFITALILAALHCLIDSCKFVCLVKYKENQVVYFVDQLLHIACIIIASIYLTQAGYELHVLSLIMNAYAPVVIDYESILLWAGLVLLLLKPANITIMKFMEKYKPVNEHCNNNDNIGEDKSTSIDNVGSLIGSLERLIIVLLMSVGQYAAIGLVLTAKSVARYNKIAEDKIFAEYYLFRTLTSTLYAVLAYSVIFRLA